MLWSNIDDLWPPGIAMESVVRMDGWILVSRDLYSVRTFFLCWLLGDNDYVRGMDWLS